MSTRSNEGCCAFAFCRRWGYGLPALLADFRDRESGVELRLWRRAWGEMAGLMLGDGLVLLRPVLFRRGLGFVHLPQTRCACAALAMITMLDERVARRGLRRAVHG